MQNTENQNNNNKNTVINNVTNNYYASQDTVQIENSMNTEIKSDKLHNNLKKWTGILAVIAGILAMVLEYLRGNLL